MNPERIPIPTWQLKKRSKLISSSSLLGHKEMVLELEQSIQDLLTFIHENHENVKYMESESKISFYSFYIIIEIKIIHD